MAQQEYPDQEAAWSLFITGASIAYLSLLVFNSIYPAHHLITSVAVVWQAGENGGIMMERWMQWLGAPGQNGEHQNAKAGPLRPLEESKVLPWCKFEVKRTE